MAGRCLIDYKQEASIPVAQKRTRQKEDGKFKLFYPLTVVESVKIQVQRLHNGDFIAKTLNLPPLSAVAFSHTGFNWMNRPRFTNNICPSQ